MARYAFILALLAALAAPAAAQAPADAAAPADAEGIEMPELIGGLGTLVGRIAYPAEAEAEGVEGRVVVSFVVTETGTVEDVEVADPVHPALDEAALSAIRRARFLPAHRDGRPLRVRMALPVTFDLQEGTR